MGVVAARNSTAEIGIEFEVGGLATVIALSSARDGRGTRPGMAEPSGKDSSQSLRLALNLEPFNLRHHRKPWLLEDGD
ncbi:MAG: hypothetical protein DHS20C12_22690 [Pseudohongiella sp.]|nr:MAG: hypothetical protein DHS20C12_22690 [Pseudohongiella sp.]